MNIAPRKVPFKENRSDNVFPKSKADEKLNYP